MTQQECSAVLDKLLTDFTPSPQEGCPKYIPFSIEVYPAGFSVGSSSKTPTGAYILNPHCTAENAVWGDMTFFSAKFIAHGSDGTDIDMSYIIDPATGTPILEFYLPSSDFDYLGSCKAQDLCDKDYCEALTISNCTDTENRCYW